MSRLHHYLASIVIVVVLVEGKIANSLFLVFVSEILRFYIYKEYTWLPC